MKRLLALFAVLVVLMGCGESGILDFFESGFADDEDDEDDDGNGEGDGDLTVDTLEGQWRLDFDASTIDDKVLLSLRNEILVGTWNADDVDDAFLADFLTGNVTKLVISENSFVFQNSNGQSVGRFTFQVASSEQLRLTSTGTNAGGTVTLRVTFDSDGSEMTLVSSGSTQGVFNIEGETEAITEYTLRITSTEFLTTITFRTGATETTEEGYTIVDDDTIQFTLEGETAVDAEAGLSDGDDRLTLTFPDSDDRGSAVFER